MRSLLLMPLLALVVTPATAAEGLPTHGELLAQGATLRDVEFHDQEYGWAVGDRGVVLRTTDGGRNWRQTPTPVDCSLYAISMVDANHGWAVGGSIAPYTHASTGVVLKTNDAGRSWERIDRGILARLRAVRFFDDQRGLAAGDGTPFNPSGVYQTDDGGRTWQPLPARAPKNWIAGDLLADGTGVVVGLRGATAWLGGRSVTPSTSFADRRGRHAVRMLDSTNGWLVGDGALVRTTRDGGRTWRSPPVEPVEAEASWFDWRALDAHGTRAWIAGSPGSVVLHTADAGHTWQRQPTPITTPIHAITMFDQRHGWAVGEFGTILATRDGGKQWNVQRHGDRRAAWSVVVGSPTELPAELLATHAIADGYHTAVHLSAFPESEHEASPTLARIEQAALHCGAEAIDAVWQFPIEPDDLALPADQLRERLASRTDGDPVDLMAERIARHWLIYRPAVLSVPAAHDQAKGLATLIAEAAGKALRMAQAEPPAATNLRPWTPEKLLQVGPESKTHTTGNRVATGDFSSLLGESPAGWARPAWGLLTKSNTIGPAAYRWGALTGHLPDDTPTAATRRDLLAGLGIARDGVARRPTAALPAGRLDQLRRIAQKRRNMERLLAQAVGDESWSGQVVNLTGGLDADAGAELLDQLAEGYRATGRSDLAADTRYLLARRYTGHPLADASLVWLIHYYASGEQAHVSQREAGQEIQTPSTLSNMTTDLSLPGQKNAPTSDTLTADARRERAARLMDYLESARPDLAADLSLRFALAAAQRGRGYGTDAKRAMLLLSKQTIADDWQRAARAEAWLAKPEGLPPDKPIANCRTTTRRPKLDGRLDEPLWSHCEPLIVGEEGDEARVYWTRDSHFLFLAAEVSRASIQQLPQDEPREHAPRPRDADLRQHDRLRIRIDIDRDYHTAYTLTIDHRGWTHDALWNDRHWRPTWFVAADHDASSWRVEVAIALNEIADPMTLDRAAWAVSVDRIHGDSSTNSWAGPRSATTSPDRFGLLLMP